MRGIDNNNPFATIGIIGGNVVVSSNFNSQTRVGLGYNYNSLNLTNTPTITLQNFNVNANVIVRLTLVASNVASFINKNIGPGLQNITWALSDFPSRTNVSTYRFDIFGTIYNATIGTLTSTTVCLAHDTQILMNDKTYLPIQNLKIGDTVASHNSENGHKIARILKTSLGEAYPVDIVKIDKDALGKDYPSATTYLTGWHPILYNNQRKPAKCFKNIPGCEWNYHSKKTADVVPADSKGKYYLYNLQFDHEGLFIANGLITQAVSPWSRIYPLPENMFYNYVEKPLTDESYITDTEWNQDILESL